MGWCGQRTHARPSRWEEEQLLKSWPFGIEHNSMGQIRRCFKKRKRGRGAVVRGLGGLRLRGVKLDAKCVGC